MSDSATNRGRAINAGEGFPGAEKDGLTMKEINRRISEYLNKRKIKNPIWRTHAEKKQLARQEAKRAKRGNWRERLLRRQKKLQIAHAAH